MEYSGQEAFHAQYTKLSVVLRVCQKYAQAANLTTKQCVDFVLLAIMTLLDRKMLVGGHVFTLQSMDKQKDGSAGWLQLTLTKLQVLVHMHAVAAELHTSKLDLGKELAQVLAKFVNHQEFDKNFPMCDEEDTVVYPCGGDDSVGEVASCPLEKAKAGLSKPATKMLDFLYNTFDGSFDADYRKLASHATPLMAMQDF